MFNKGYQQGVRGARKPLAGIIASLAAAASMLLSGCGTTVGGATLTGSVQGMSPELVARARSVQALYARHVSRPTTWNNSLELYPDRTAQRVLLDMLSSARRNIFIETFEFHDDQAGVDLANLLVAKKDAGIDVKVIVDRIGSKSVKSKLYQRLLDHGIATTVYGPFPFLRKSGNGLNITHRKLYLVDGDKAMTGGMNLGGEYFGTYHDMLFKVQGDTAYALHEEFAGDWQRGRGVGAITLPPAPQGTYGSEPIGIAVTSPRERGREHEIHETLLKAIDDAKVRIDMAYPYFSDDDVLDHLVAARARGVKVHVILTTHDGPMIHRTAVWSAHQTKRKGLDFHWWTTSYAHIKYTAIDDAFLAVGSSNADTLTFDNNQELDLLLTNPRTIGDFRQRIVEPDWAATPEVTDADVNVPASEKPLYALLEILDHYI